LGTPARSANSHNANAENGVAVAGFNTKGSPRPRPGLPLGDYRRRKIPRRDRCADTYRAQSFPRVTVA